MRILSLWQPWATLIALGEKTIETRSWGTSYRGPLAIHAAAKWAGAATLARGEPFRSILQAHGITGAEQLPLGAIVCVTKLVDCIPTDGLEVVQAILKGGRMERQFGDYGPGRRAWILARPPIPLDPPIPYKGAQGLRSMPAAIAGDLAQRLLAV